MKPFNINESTEAHRFPTRAAALATILDFLRKEGVADAAQFHTLSANSFFLKSLDKERLSDGGPGPPSGRTRNSR